jgi:dienelactone hydrolase
MRFLFVLAIWLFSAATAHGAVKEREVEYKSGAVAMKGLLAFDDAQPGRRPAILVVHEWWGHDEHARNSARRLAAAGYVALAVDIYGEGRQAHHPQDAAKLLTEVRSSLPLMQARFDAARDLLRSQSNVDAERMGAIGYCFGGAVVLEMARSGADLQGVVSVHGLLDTTAPAKPDTVKPQILVLTGGADPFVPQDQVDAFDREMKSAGARYRIVIYPGVKHSFTNPASTKLGKQFDIPDEYNAEAAEKSWNELLAFFANAMLGRGAGSSR